MSRIAPAQRAATPAISIAASLAFWSFVLRGDAAGPDFECSYINDVPTKPQENEHG
jgi:hypothetical protein